MNAQVQTRNHMITADLLVGLPEPVRRYMSYTGVVGKPWIDTVRLKYTGRFRMGADKPWMPISASQVYTTNPPGFFWKVWFKMAGLPFMFGHDTFKDGHGHMIGKVAGLFTVVDGQGEEMDQGTMVRYLQEMTWFPIAYLGDNITWQTVDDHAADVTLHAFGKSVSARMYFDDAGRLLNFVARRYGENNGAYALHIWSTPVTVYRKMAGLNLPVGGLGVWQFPSGDLPYIDILLSEIEYNQPVEAF